MTRWTYEEVREIYKRAEAAFVLADAALAQLQQRLALAAAALEQQSEAHESDVADNESGVNNARSE